VRIRLASAALAIVGAVGALYTARVAAARIEGNPDPFPRGRLTAEPDGEEVFISRPDGTVLRAMVGGRADCDPHPRILPDPRAVEHRVG
jgi:non-heme chloroperoxidase